MLELYGDKAIATASLRESAEAYDAWRISKRREFRRKRSLSKEWLDERLPLALESGELAVVLDNSKLLHFASSVLRDGARLDYRTLKLVQG